MLDASGGAPIACCCACAALQQAIKHMQKDVASLMSPIMFFHPVIETSLRWLIEKDIIAKRARIALRLVDREHLFFWGGNHVAASY
jgi:hypothetical protein